MLQIETAARDSAKDKRDAAALWGAPAPEHDKGPAYTENISPTEDAVDGEFKDAEPQAQQPSADDIDALDLDALKETWSYIYKTAPKGDKPQGIAPSYTEAQWRDHIRAYRASQSKP